MKPFPTISSTDHGLVPLIALDTPSLEIHYINESARELFLSADSPCFTLENIFKSEDLLELKEKMQLHPVAKDEDFIVGLLGVIDAPRIYEVRIKNAKHVVFLTFIARPDLERKSQLSHALNNPLAIVASSAELALKGEMDEQTQRLLEKILKSAHRMRDIIKSEVIR